MEPLAPQTAAEPSRTFRAMPGKGKAVVVITWIQLGLAALLAVVGLAGFLGLSQAERAYQLEQPGTGLALVTLVWALLVGALLFAMSFLLIKAKNWARIVLIVFYSLSVAILPIGLMIGVVTGTDFRNFILGIIMLFLLTSQPVRDWCTYTPAAVGGDPFTEKLKRMNADQNTAGGDHSLR